MTNPNNIYNFAGWLAALVVMLSCQLNSSSAWTVLPVPTPFSRTTTSSISRRSSRLYYVNDGDIELDLTNNAKPPRVCRAVLEGVSLAPQGFWTMLRIGEDSYLPWQVTDDPQDAYAATSAEALTIIQLLSGVDMAGAILPPDVLAKLVVLECENLGSTSEMAQAILAFVQESLPDDKVAFSEVSQWAQARVKLPTASLDELFVNPEDNTFSLTCSIRNFGTLTFTPTPPMLQSVLYQFSPSTSLAFTSLALALRYHAPMTVVQLREHEGISRSALETNFPLFKTTSELQQSSHRVQENIVRGFEIHKLQGALRIAMERGDSAAAQKIRAKLDEYDSMESLPTAEFEPEQGVLQQNMNNCTDVLQ